MLHGNQENSLKPPNGRLQARARLARTFAEE